MMVVKTKGSACTSGCTCLDTAADTHARSCYCMNDSCSVTAPAQWKKPPDDVIHRWGEGKRRGRRKKKISQKIWESFAPTGGKWVVLCAPKNGVTFNEKGENKYNVENLDSSKLSAATEDCRAWWMVKEGKQSSNRQRGINYSYFLCAWVCARAWHCNCLLKLF